MSENGTAPAVGSAETRALVLERIREDSSFVLATHENMDGDAIGSLLAMQGLLTALGKDSLMFVPPGELPLPLEYRFFDLSDVDPVAPADIAQRTVVLLDCGNIDRNSADALRDGAHLLNIDHHHDNTRFGTVDHVVADASCTAEIIWDLMHGLGVSPAPAVAQALYVGLVTDTGRFMYENTGPRAHLMAAELIEAGVDVQAIYRRLYEEMPYPKLALLALGLAAGAALRRGRAGDRGAERRGLPPRGGRGELLRGDHRPPARRAGHEGRRARARADGAGAPRRAQSVAARHRRRRRRLGDRPRPGGRGAPPRRRLLHLARARAELIEFLRGEIAAQLHPAPAPA